MPSVCRYLTHSMKYPYLFLLILAVALVSAFATTTLSSTLPLASSSAISATNRVRIHHGWQACRSKKGQQQQEECWNITSLPTTAFMVLLEHDGNKTNNTKVHPDNIYFSKNLASSLPDISIVGRDYYTLTYRYHVPPLPPLEENGDGSVRRRRQILRFHGINYRVSQAYWNGRPIKEVNDFDSPSNNGASSSELDGMFRRRHYEVTSDKGGIFRIQIEPPLHPGLPIPGQGGDHDLAKDGATSQFMLGWDWCQPTPDRSTGFLGPVELHTTQSAYAILDPAIQTLEIECNHVNDEGLDEAVTTNSCQKVVLMIQAHIECNKPEGLPKLCREGAPIILRVTSDWGEVWNVEWETTGSKTDIQSQAIQVQRPEEVHLWWPNGLDPDSVAGVDGKDVARLHSFQFDVIHLTKNIQVNSSIAPAADNNEIVSDSTIINVGIRTVSTYLDGKLQGQIFMVNNQRIYLVGGNWITTDQAMRYSASPERYCNELNLMKYAGLNLIRVWGGGITETTDFYECADKLGLLIYQEFWMTGDNNGRWAGNYTWPLNYQSYLSNAKDVVRRLRRHPSLLFYGGCNECLAPRGQLSPPRTIDDGIRDAIRKYDHPDRFYIPSSMGGPNKADTATNKDPTLWFNRSYSLSFADGPYSMLMPETYFDRNPGLNFKNISIGFQAEIGSSSAPTYMGLLRFMTSDEAESGFPRNKRNGAPSNVDDDDEDVWTYHKFSSWKSNNGTYDYVYAYLDNSSDSASIKSDNLLSFANASEWCAAAQLAAHKQYQHMFEGYISHMFEYTAAVIMWKAQSPWPALRGFLYDWYLESTGTLYGFRAALHRTVSVVFDVSTWRIKVINRSSTNVTTFNDDRYFNNGTCNFIVSYKWIAVNGTTIKYESIPLSRGQSGGNNSGGFLPPMSVMSVGDATTDTLLWPKDCHEVCFLHLTSSLGHAVGSTRGSSTWYWLQDPKLQLGNEFAALGRMRSRQNGIASLHIDGCTLSPKVGLIIRIRIVTSMESPAPLFYPTFSLHYEDKIADDSTGPTTSPSPILPLFDSEVTEIVILQGETQHRELTSPRYFDHLDYITGMAIQVRMDSWNGAIAIQTATCLDQSATV